MIPKKNELTKTVGKNTVRAPLTGNIQQNEKLVHSTNVLPEAQRFSVFINSETPVAHPSNSLTNLLQSHYVQTSPVGGDEGHTLKHTSVVDIYAAEARRLHAEAEKMWQKQTESVDRWDCLTDDDPHVADLKAWTEQYELAAVLIGERAASLDLTVECYGF